jgi:hypothetical protein
MRILMILLALVTVGCANLSPRPTQIKAEVIDYTPHAYHSDYDDGRWETYDVVNFKLLSPPKLENAYLSVLMHPENTYTFLRDKGTQCSFQILPEVMKLISNSENSSVEIFEGAIQNLKKRE